MLVVLIIARIINMPFPLVGLLVVSALVAAVFLFFCLFLRWMFCWRNFKRALFALACFATLIALFYAEEDWRGRHAWNQFKQKWEARGEHLEFSGVVPPPVPADKNFAMTPIVFTSYGYLLNRQGEIIPYNTNFDQRMDISVAPDYEKFPAGGMGNWQEQRFANLAAWQSYYRQLATKTNVFPVPKQAGSPAGDVLMALSQYDDVMEALRKASQLPDSRFPLNYDTTCPATILLPHLAPLKKCGQVLELRSLAELQDNEPEKAMEDVLLALELSGKVRSEPFLISHLVRIAMVQGTQQPIWEGLARHNWSDTQLARLDAALARLDFLADYRLSIRGELGLKCGNFKFMRNHRNQLFDMIGSMDQESSSLIWGELIPGGWFYQNQLRCARIMLEHYLPVADPGEDTFSPAVARHAEGLVETETKAITPYNVMERLMVPALSNAARKFAHAQSSVDLARVAIALERYRLAHGEYPETLDSVTPKFITKLPHDVIGGKSLHYRRTGDGLFVLYSVGWNETDDGGTVVDAPNSKPPRVDINEGDWVWRYPGK